jgi:hypothetical protein
MADLWSDYTDSLITDIDSEMGSKYKMSLREILTDPGKYERQPNLDVTLSNMREDVDKYVDGLLTEMKEESRSLENDMAKVNSITLQLTQNISMQARQHDIALIKPAEIERDTDKDETIVLNTLDDQAIKLVEKLISKSLYVADFSYLYKTYNIGSWFFGGEKDYLIHVYVPENDALDLEMGREEIDSLIDDSIKLSKGV